MNIAFQANNTAKMLDRLIYKTYNHDNPSYASSLQGVLNDFVDELNVKYSNKYFIHTDGAEYRIESIIANYYLFVNLVSRYGGWCKMSIEHYNINDVYDKSQWMKING